MEKGFCNLTSIEEREINGGNVMGRIVGGVWQSCGFAGFASYHAARDLYNVYQNNYKSVQYK